MKIGALREERIAKEVIDSLRRNSSLRHSMLAFFMLLSAGWSDVASSNAGCASQGQGGNWICVPFEYGAWRWSAGLPPAGAGIGFSTATDAYNAQLQVTASYMNQAHCTYTISALSAFTSNATDTYETETINLSYGNLPGAYCGYGTGSDTGYVVGVRDRSCPQGTIYHECGAMVITLQNQLANLEPSGTVGGGNSSETVYAQVINKQTNLPEPGAQVKFSVDAKAGTGGHDHIDALRPKGKLLDCRYPYSEVDTTVCITQLDGKATVTFSAPIVSGTHTITATCVSPACTGPASGDINVKVDGLETILASQFYALNEDSGKVIGATDKHSNNHYLTPDAASALWRMAAAYHFESQFKLNGVSPPLLHLNDASLVWGGKFDVFGYWTTGDHAEHRRGTVIDIRANSNTGAIPPENFIAFMTLAAFYGADAKIHHPGEVTQHFHVRLLNKGE